PPLAANQEYRRVNEIRPFRLQSERHAFLIADWIGFPRHGPVPDPAAARGRATDRSARCRWFLFRKRVVTLAPRGRGADSGAERELPRRRLGVRERRDPDKTGEDRSRLDEPLHFCPPADRGRSAISINAATTNMPE